MKLQSQVFWAVCLAATLSAAGEVSVKPSLNSHLEPLRPLLGKTWKGEFVGSKPDQPTVDIARWERALNGQAVRLLHSINHGVYGGETLFIWDDKRQAVVYYYFTTASFMTTGTLEVKDGNLVTHEEVKGNAGGVTEVRSTSQILPNGKLHVKAEHLKAGHWTLGHEVTYEEDPSSEVVFK
jgi:hypothetical protein